MSIDLSKIKISINDAINLSIAGRPDEAFSLLSFASLSKEQSVIIKSILEDVSFKKPKNCISEKVKIIGILTATPKELIAKSNMDSDEKKGEGFGLKTAKINFLGKGFVNNTVLGNDPRSDLIGANILERQLVNIRCYSNFDKLISDFNFSQNGIQFFKINDYFLDCINSFSRNPLEKASELNLSKATTNFLSIWGKENGINFDVAVPLGFLYRDLNPNETKAAKAYHLTHVDLREIDIPALEMKLKPQMKAVLGELSPEQYTNANITQIVNVWMPLNTSTNTLSLLDTNSFNPLTELRPFHNVSADGVTSLSLLTNPNQRWITQLAMTIGQGVVFNSCLTPHSAIDLPEEYDIKYDKYRRSIEGRFAFVSYKPKLSSNQNSSKTSQ